MCTIALATRWLDGAPLAVGANREERYGRPAIAPGRLEAGPVVYGPMDLAAGGTWIAINERGLLVAVTNRDGGPAGQRSRGWLVRDLARADHVEEAVTTVKTQLDEHRYAGFNLLVADPDRAVAMAWDGSLDERVLPPGIHVIVNEGMNGEVAKSATVSSRLQAAEPRSLADWERRCQTVLRDHGLGVCRHGAAGGTRSSSLVSRSTDGTVRWLFADGAPCEHRHRMVYRGTLAADAE